MAAVRLLLPAETEAVDGRRLDALLRPLGDGVARDYAALGRGVPAGKETRMLVRHAAARPVRTRAGDFVTRVDLVGDRWLRVKFAASSPPPSSSPTMAATTTAASSTLPRQAYERTAPHEAPALGLVLAEAGAADELDLEWRFAERLCNSPSSTDASTIRSTRPTRRPSISASPLHGATKGLRCARRVRGGADGSVALDIRIEPPVAVGALLEDFVGDVEPMDEGVLVIALVGARR